MRGARCGWGGVWSSRSFQQQVARQHRRIEQFANVVRAWAAKLRQRMPAWLFRWPPNARTIRATRAEHRPITPRAILRLPAPLEVTHGP